MCCFLAQICWIPLPFQNKSFIKTRTHYTTAAIVAYPFRKTETEFTIPAEIKGKTVVKIAMHLFRENGTLKKITVPDTVTKIGGFAFNGMKVE